jgi:probable non-F420 flavinoid oxidoreductase
MPLIGYHASHEQFTPRDLLGFVQQAERAGFDAAMCSDHFHPWSEAQGQCGHAWTWLGSAMAATQLPHAVVNCPVGRYHPAVIAQAVATLLQMHGDRFTLIAGSGEEQNEAITGKSWPPKDVRNRRLQAAVEVMRALWRGEEVTHRGPRDEAFVVERARLYSLPENITPKVFAAALSPETARWAASWADGLATISMPREKLQKVVDAFREGGGEGKPLWLQVKLSYAGSDDEALRGAHAQWRTNVMKGEVSQDLRTPAQFEAAAQMVKPEDMREAVRVSADTQRHLDWLHEDCALGFERLFLHNVNRGQQRFIDDFGAQVLPRLRKAREA